MEKDIQKGVGNLGRTRHSSTNKCFKDLETAIEALNNIVNPIGYIKNEARKDGYSINGYMAVEVTNKAQFYKDIAEEALMKIKNN